MLLLDAPRAPAGVPSPFARLRAADAARHVAGVSPRAARFLVRAGDARGDDVLLRGAPACVGAALADLADDARPPASRRATLVPSEPPLLCQGPARDLARKLWACAQEILPWSFDADRVPDVVTDRFVGVDEGGVRVIEHGRDTAFVDVTPRLDHIDVDGAAGAVRARALRDAFDVVNEPEPHELKLVAGWLAPRHDRLLAALAALGDAAHVEKRGRLLWRITTAPTLAVGARLEPPGRLPRLRRVSLRAVADGSVACACEAERTAAALVLAGRPADAVRALAGHPAVVVDGRGGAAFRVVDAPLGAALLDVDGGFSVELVAAGVRVPAMAVAAAAIGEAVVAVDRRARVVVVTQPTPSLRALAAAVASTGGFVPAAARTAVAGAVRGLSTATVPVSLPSSFAPPRRAPADARLFVRLSDEDSGLMVAIGVRPDRSARLLPPGEGPGLVAGLVDGRRADLLRDRDDEVERARSLRATIDVDGTFLGDGWGAVIAPGDDADLAFLERLHREVRRRDDVVLEWRDPDKAKTVEGELTAAALRLRVRSIEGWLGVEGGVELDGAVLSFAALLEAVRAGRKYVALSPGRFVAIAASVGGLLAPLAGAGPAARLAAPVAAEALAALADAGAVFDDTDAWRDVARRVELARACTGDPPAGLCADLRPYQKDGVRFLRRLQAWGTGGVLADDMGLGKTLQAISAVVERAPGGAQLVVAPTSVCFNWERELARFAPLLSVHALARARDRAAVIAAAGAGDVVVVSYALAALLEGPLRARRFTSVVFDEAQALKNADAQRTRLARKLDADWKLALSGTPLENRLGELWSLMAVTTPGLFGPPKEFRDRFVLPVEKHKSAEARAALSERIRPFLLRRTRGEVAGDLPHKTELTVPVDMNERDAAIYDATRAAVLADLHDENEAPADRRFRALVGLQRLRMIACHPALVDKELAREPSTKQIAALHLVRGLVDNGHRVLVFSQFLGHLDIVERALLDAGVATLRLDGGTPARERARLIDTFQCGVGDAFLISLKAGGTGLNLTAADSVVHLDPWWNPAVEDQATARAHRLGQTRPVTVYRLVARDSIEERMLEVHEEKRDLVDGVLEGADAAGRLSLDELAALLRR